MDAIELRASLLLRSNKHLSEGAVVAENGQGVGEVDSPNIYPDLSAAGPAMALEGWH
jgi:hypothetical protein